MKQRLFVSLMLILCWGSSIIAQDAAQLNQTAQDFSGVAKVAIPAVVSIQVKSKPASSGFLEYDPSYPTFNDDFFGRFFGIPRQDKPQTQTSQASGFIVSPDGYILTNNHVVREGSEIMVKLNDGREFPGKIIGADDSTDVALVKIEANDLPFLKLGNSDDLNVGQWVVAIGNTLGLRATLTVGVVSAKGRNNLDLAQIEDFIQTDAAINRGNSGGPLLNLNEEVIGINTAIATGYGSGYMGIGFAIPSNMAKHVMEQLKSTGSVKRGYLGILLQGLDEELAQAFELKNAEGALIADVMKGSPAEKAGLKQGDIVLKVDGKSVDNIGVLRNYIALQNPGNKITLTLLRDKKSQDVSVEIGSSTQETAKTSSSAKSVPNRLGIEVQTLTPELAQSLNLPPELQGVVVTEVLPQSPVTLVGLRKGAVILSINHHKISSKQEYEALLKEIPEEKPVLLLVKQGEAVRYVSIRITSK